MEPNDDRQLRDLLQEWQTPAIPASLEQRVFKPHRSWGFLLHGSIRVPVPVLYCLIALLMFAGWRMSVRTSQTAPCVANCDHTTSGAC